jgi:hypothetical protein
MEETKRCRLVHSNGIVVRKSDEGTARAADRHESPRREAGFRSHDLAVVLYPSSLFQEQRRSASRTAFVARLLAGVPLNVANPTAVYEHWHGGVVSATARTTSSYVDGV